MSEFSMSKAVGLLNRWGIPAYVEQTGGGCATIYAGERSERDADGNERYQAAAGPGWFRGPGWTNIFGDTEDFYIGPDDDGEADTVQPAPSATYVDVAHAIRRQLGVKPVDSRGITRERSTLT